MGQLSMSCQRSIPKAVKSLTLMAPICWYKFARYWDVELRKIGLYPQNKA